MRSADQHRPRNGLNTVYSFYMLFISVTKEVGGEIERGGKREREGGKKAESGGEGEREEKRKVQAKS